MSFDESNGLWGRINRAILRMGLSDICTGGRYYYDFEALCEWFVTMGDKMFYKIH